MCSAVIDGVPPHAHPHPHPHILVFPYPAQGHTLPLLDLTHQLCLRNLAVTILTTPKNYPSLSPLLSLHPTIHALLLPFPPHPSLPPGVENVGELGNHGNKLVIAALTKLFDPVVQWFSSHHNPPVAIISDFFLGWTTALASLLNIPRFAFYSSGAFLTAVNNHCWRHIDSVSKSKVVDFFGLPGSPSFKEEHLPSIFRFYRESDPDWEIIKDGMVKNMESFGLIFNSFKALEGEYLSHLTRDLGHERVYGVGPLSLIGPDNSGRGSLEDVSSYAHVFDWLDGCPDGSVLYVCFGSQKLVNKEQMHALACALEKSMARFIWVVKSGTTQQTEEGYGVVPDGFEEGVAGRGVVIRGWAPQTMLLSHRAVGGFMSHCGWNSTLEGIVAGVMLLAWPMEADQFVNARLLVEDMGVAVRACEGADAVPHPAHLAKLIAHSMGSCEQEKARAKEFKHKALAAVESGGSSSRDMEAIVMELRKLPRQTTT